MRQNGGPPVKSPWRRRHVPTDVHLEKAASARDVAGRAARRVKPRGGKPQNGKKRD
jgi:hypothetical protein